MTLPPTTWLTPMLPLPAPPHPGRKSTVTSLVTQVTLLTGAVASLQTDMASTRAQIITILSARPPPPPVVNHPQSAAPPRAPPPIPQRPAPAPKATKAFFAPPAVSGGPSSRQIQQWTIATPTTKPAKPKEPPLMTPGDTKINRQLIVELSAPIPDTVMNDTIVEAVNSVLTPSGTKLVLVSRTCNANLSWINLPIPHTTYRAGTARNPTSDGGRPYVLPCCYIVTSPPANIIPRPLEPPASA